MMIREWIAAALDRIAYSIAMGAARMRAEPDQLGPIWRPGRPQSSE